MTAAPPVSLNLRRHFALQVAVFVIVKRKILCNYPRKSNQNLTV